MADELHVAIYDETLHKAGAQLVWHDCGWSDKVDACELLDTFFDLGPTWVGIRDEAVQSVVHTAAATLRYQQSDIRLQAVTGVTTSLQARRGGVAANTLAHAMAAGAANGAVVSALGIFDQGFYDRLGYGSLDIMRLIRFDPKDIRVDATARSPLRFTEIDVDEIHAARSRRWLRHGGVNFDSAKRTLADMQECTNGIGFGYRDHADGGISHMIWFSRKDAENGPFRVIFTVWETREQLRELMAFLHTLADQVHLVVMEEPPGIALQDFIHRPLRSRAITQKSKYETGITAMTYQQARIVNLQAAIEKLSVHGPSIDFNLIIKDPVTRFLPQDTPWSGCGGNYTIHIGEKSTLKTGHTDGLETLSADIGAFSRLWLGSSTATALAVTSDFDGPEALLSALDACICLPVPRFDWNY
ncbi:MAG: hypothetical protein RL169_312 [Armatimonadota bacterium]|jgi:predicted acetyltransferase